MDEAERYGMQAVLVELATQKERSASRDATLAQMQVTLAKMEQRLDTVAGDVRDAKTVLRVGFWISTTLVPAIAAMTGWFAHTFWGGK